MGSIGLITFAHCDDALGPQPPYGTTLGPTTQGVEHLTQLSPRLSSFRGMYRHSGHLRANFWKRSPHALHSITLGFHPSRQYGVTVEPQEEHEQPDAVLCVETRREVVCRNWLGTRCASDPPYAGASEPRRFMLSSVSLS